MDMHFITLDIAIDKQGVSELKARPRLVEMKF